VIGQWVRMSPDGTLTLRPQVASETPVWSVAIGEQGTITDWGRKLDRSTLYNAVISTGNSSGGVPAQGIAVETSGPLRWDGPFGRVPYAYNSPLLATTTAAEDDAETRLARMIRERVAPISVTCTANPALELDDVVELRLPTQTLVGQVSSITWTLPGTVMTMVVLVPRSQIWGA
jgi:hypothetical protein